MTKVIHVGDDGAKAWGFIQTRKQLQELYGATVTSLTTEDNTTGLGGAIRYPYQFKNLGIEYRDNKSLLISKYGTLLDLIRWYYKNQQLVDVTTPLAFVCGTNKGCNSTCDFLHSSTLASAIWAATKELPAIAISLDLQLYQAFEKDSTQFKVLLDDIFNQCMQSYDAGLVHAFNIRTPQAVYYDCFNFKEEASAANRRVSSHWRLDVKTW